ncbi:fimbrial protein [Atlantibacter sp.]|uniref:fimbrial protein n=1 Tax=Atlantibacter sp. TaxID=1903473 RepID=UPI0028A9B4D2|nr:fimbrial protein [Atlantibacter sp.]
MKGIYLLLCAALGATAHSALAAQDNVHFTGALVSEPCTLPEPDKTIILDFGSVIEKSLYEYQRTKSKPFSIHLQDCDPAILSTVSVTFEGDFDPELTNMLSLDASSTAKGVALGLELADGTPLAINKPTPYIQLASGNNTLTFNAFVQAQPTVITANSLVAGDFTATASFVLTYQ